MQTQLSSRRNLGIPTALAACTLALLGVAAVALLLAPEAEATHFRAGTMQWHHAAGTLPEPPVEVPYLPNYNNLQPAVNMSMTVAFRASYPWPQPAPQTPNTDLCGAGTGCAGGVNWGDGATTSTYELWVTQYDPDLDMVYVRFVEQGTNQDMFHRYPSNSAAQYTASWPGNCCRLSYPPTLQQSHINNPDKSWHLETIIDLTRSNYSPRAVLIPIRSCPQSGWCEFQTFASDLDNDTLTYRLSTDAEATGGQSFAQPGPCPPYSGSPGCGSPGTATIDNNGTVRWFVTGATIRPAPIMTYYSMQIMIQDETTKIPLDYFIRLDPPQPAPICDPMAQTVMVGQTAYWNTTGNGNVWAAPGGTPPNGNGNAGSTTYDEPGTYYVTVTNSGSSVECLIEVVWPPPICMPATQTRLIQERAWFNASSGPSSNYSWSAPYGVPTAQPTAPAPAGARFNTIYDNPGTFTVIITSENLTGTCTVIVPEPSCTPASQQVMVAPAGASLRAAGGDGTYRWSLPMGGSPASGAGATFSPSFQYDGTYPVDLTSHGITVRCQVVVVTPPPGTDYSWTQSQAGCGPHPVTFTDMTRGNATLVSWLWDFGDGTTSSVPNPTHEYASSGTYTVTLTVTDRNQHSTAMSRIFFIVGDVDCEQGRQAPFETGQSGQAPQDGKDGALAGGDSDSDGVPDGKDLCVAVADPLQGDLDLDGFGDACDVDMDGDGVRNVADNCVAVVNANQVDLEADGQGDACDQDRDGDGYDNADDLCPSAADTQLDADKNGVGDACQTVAPKKVAGANQDDAAVAQGPAVGVSAPVSVEASVPPSTMALVALALALPAVVAGIAIWRRRA